MTKTGQRRARVPTWKGVLFGLVFGVTVSALTWNQTFWQSMGTAVVFALALSVVLVAIKLACARWGSQQ